MKKLTADAYDFIIVGPDRPVPRCPPENPNGGSCWKRAPPPLGLALSVSFGLLIDNPAANWCYRSEPEETTALRRIPVPRGTAFWAAPAQSMAWFSCMTTALRYLGPARQSSPEFPGRSADLSADGTLRAGRQ